jgi:hypothetical protein
MKLGPFGTRSAARFAMHLDRTTRRLLQRLPRRAQHWGLARKGLNIFLRDCLYTAYLRERYGLHRAEASFELPLDSITAKRLREADPDLPRWPGVRGLDPNTSRVYQQAATTVADWEGSARIHLDAVWWGARSRAHGKAASSRRARRAGGKP